MNKINSKDNKIYKLCSKLASKKYRDTLGLYLIEGENLIREAIKTGTEISTLIYRENAAATDIACASESFSADQKLFEKIAQTETSQGVLAIVKKSIWSEDEFFNRALGKNVIVLDRLQDPGNIGTIIRTADAAGYAGAIILKGTGDVYGPKVVRAASGSLFRLPVLMVPDPASAIALLRKHGKRIISTCLDADVCYYDAELQSDIALIIGNEGNGICEVLVEAADLKIKIPMEGSVDSLNASVAAGILMYERRRSK